MGACWSSESQPGAPATASTTDKATTSSKDEPHAPKDTVKITIEQVDDTPKELEAVEESDVVKQRDDEAAENNLRKEEAVAPETQRDGKETNESADAASEPVVSAAPESAGQDKEGASTEAYVEVATTSSSEVVTEERKVSEKEETTGSGVEKEPQIELALPGTVESEPRQAQASDNISEQEEAVECVAPGEIQVSTPSAAEKGETENTSDAQEVEQNAEEPPQPCLEKEGSPETEQAARECEEIVAVESDAACTSVEEAEIVDPQTAKQADSIAKDFVAPLEDTVIASFVDKQNNVMTPESEQEYPEQGEA